MADGPSALRAPASAHEQKGGSPFRADALRPVTERQLRHREVEWRAAGGERPVRRMTNSIRPDAVTSQRSSGEVQTERKPIELRGRVRKQRWDCMGWLETEWSGRSCDVKQGDLMNRCSEGLNNGATSLEEPPGGQLAGVGNETVEARGVRAFIVAEKRRNGRGAKGRREMDDERKLLPETSASSAPRG